VKLCVPLFGSPQYYDAVCTGTECRLWEMPPCETGLSRHAFTVIDRLWMKNRGHLRDDLAANLSAGVVGGMDVDIPEPSKQGALLFFCEFWSHTVVLRTPGGELDDDGGVLAWRGRGMEVGIRFRGRQRGLLVADTEAELVRLGVERHKRDPKRLAVIRVRRGLLPAIDDGGKGKRLRPHGHSGRGAPPVHAAVRAARANLRGEQGHRDRREQRQRGHLGKG
jgi:hypothetical protein